MKTLKMIMIALVLTGSVAFAQTPKNTHKGNVQSSKTPAKGQTVVKKSRLNPETIPSTTSQPISAPGATTPASTLEPAIVPGNPTYPSTIVPGNTTQPASVSEVTGPVGATNVAIEPAAVPGNPTYPGVSAPSAVNEGTPETESQVHPRKREVKRKRGKKP
jgi:hypothetical protein